MENEFDLMYNPEELVECRHCHWTGKLKETKGEYINTPPEAWHVLAGREGYEYFCPKCRFIVASHYTRIS